MPKKLTPMQAAMIILDIYLHEFEGRPNRTVNTPAFMNVWDKRALPVDSFKRGMEFAIKAGWVEFIDARALYRLTKTGYEKTIPMGSKLSQ